METMNSPFANIYLDILAHIQDQVKDISQVAQDVGQLEGYVRRPQLAFPCVLIDFQNWNFTNLAENAQLAEGDVLIKLAFTPYQNEDSLTEEQWRKLALEYYELEYALNKALHGFAPNDNCGYLTRAGADRENRLGIRIRHLRYRLEFEDYSAQPQKEDTINRPAISIANDHIDQTSP